MTDHARRGSVPPVCRLCHSEIMRWMGALLLLPLALAAQTKTDDPCAVSGQVSNAATGEPVRRALVYLRRIDMSPGVTNIQVTNTAVSYTHLRAHETRHDL